MIVVTKKQINMTLIDLRLEYKRQTGEKHIHISHDNYADVRYVMWLEERLLKLKALKKKLIPWENEL